MNKLYIYILFIILGLCIYLYINKKDTFNIGGQVPLFMCSNEEYKNHPNCLPDAFCQNLKDGEICTVDNLDIDENNKGYFMEYYENLIDVLSNFNNGLNCIYENIGDIEKIPKRCPNSYLAILGSVPPALCSAIPLRYYYDYRNEINIANKIELQMTAGILNIIMGGWEYLNNKVVNIELHNREAQLTINIRLPSFFYVYYNIQNNNQQITSTRDNLLQVIEMYMTMLQNIIITTIQKIKDLETQFNLNIPWREVIMRNNRIAYNRFQSEIEN
jgi:hypothetical protein